MDFVVALILVLFRLLGRIFRQVGMGVRQHFEMLTSSQVVGRQTNLNSASRLRRKHLELEEDEPTPSWRSEFTYDRCGANTLLAVSLSSRFLNAFFPLVRNSVKSGLLRGSSFGDSSDLCSESRNLMGFQPQASF